jgi:hypothetical protein
LKDSFNELEENVKTKISELYAAQMIEYSYNVLKTLGRFKYTQRSH